MQREIKFRAFDKKLCIIIPHEEMSCDNYVYGRRALLSGFLQNKDYEVMQYTGLKDKNGKEIYEGDIVESNGSMSFSAYDSENGSKREIFVSDCGFTGVRINNDFDKSNCSSAHIWNNYQLWNTHKSLTIIGNIYENPELLENKL